MSRKSRSTGVRGRRYTIGQTPSPDAPNSVNKFLDNKGFSDAIKKGMNKYLGER